MLELMTYYGDMVKERRKKPSDDLASALLEAEIDGDRLVDQEIIAFLLLMVSRATRPPPSCSPTPRTGATRTPIS